MCLTKRNTLHCKPRDVSAGATGATAVAPKFSDALTLFQPGGAYSALPFQRLHHKFPRGYVSVTNYVFNYDFNFRIVCGLVERTWSNPFIRGLLFAEIGHGEHAS